ncbi:MAG: fatty acid desaturase family protein, partial [Bauldia sp.]|nr:fatty acid desaturase family protein [Bauldia sp.]
MTADAAGRDYSITAETIRRTDEMGLGSAAWYKSPIPRKQLKELMQRSDGPAIRDTIIWIGGMIVSGVAGYLTWGTWWAVPCFIVYGVLYGGASDSRWHECGHRTAFKTTWMNDAVYEIACFMSLREPTVWRGSHTRHHTDTIIVGRDPEIAVPRPPDILGILLNIFMLKASYVAMKSVVRHATGRVSEAEATFIPESERRQVYHTARIWLLIFAAVIGASIATGSILPLMYVGLPTLYGGWFVILVGLTQHAGLAEDVLDHRLNARTVHMNPVFRFLYWNMNYHVEHHMFPTVPYHALPKLHEAMKADTPPPYPNILAAYREIVPTLARQVKDPAYHVVRPLPAAAKPYADYQPFAN